MKITGFVPKGMAVFGIVILLKPELPSSPVKLKDIVVLVELAVDIFTLDICEFVMFPLIAKYTVTPFSLVAAIMVSDWCGVGDGV